MADNSEGNKGGAGKFFLGALLGGIAGAIAGKFIKLDTDGGEEIEDTECECGDECECKKEACEKKVEEVKKEEKEVKKPVAKKTSEKK